MTEERKQFISLFIVKDDTSIRSFSFVKDIGLMDLTKGGQKYLKYEV